MEIAKSSKDTGRPVATTEPPCTQMKPVHSTVSAYNQGATLDLADIYIPAFMPWFKYDYRGCTRIMQIFTDANNELSGDQQSLIKFAVSQFGDELILYDLAHGRATYNDVAKFIAEYKKVNGKEPEIAIPQFFVSVWAYVARINANITNRKQ
jgi:hypothetical protein